PEQGWNREETLQHLCRKAGLPLDAWKKDTTFYVFTAEVFHEVEP
ncbi:MAG: AMMECR1 domain-containing protein, partial [Planctomycetes bacterium]|nr:AMMECR1 domain-containing protein [Planctomycetota bacterium]